MLSLGATVEQIAEALGLDVEIVRQVANNSQSSQDNTALFSVIRYNMGGQDAHPTRVL
jgi:hypothetical protein